MPFDSNGVFSRVMNWTQDQQDGIAIECGRHDDEDDNFANGFNDCFCRDGRAAATGNFNLSSHKIQNLAAGTATTDAVNKGQIDNITTNMVKLSGNQTIAGTKTFSASPNVPTPATSDNSTKVATTAYVKDQGYALDNSVVHIEGAETITGVKTFSQTGTDASIVQSTTLTTDGAYVDLIQNINNNRRGTLRTMYDADDDSYTVTLGCNGPNAVSPSGIDIKRTVSAVTVTAPTPATSANNTEVATTAFVKNQGYAHLSGNETIAGTKTFSSTISGNINGNAATVTNGVYTTGNQTIGGTKTFSAAAYGTASGAANSLLTTVASLFETSGTNKRYLKLGNGWIIQVGEFTYESGNGEVEVLLNQTMTSTKYFVGITFLTTARNSPGCVTGRYTNKFKYKSSSFQSSGTALYVVIGK